MRSPASPATFALLACAACSGSPPRAPQPGANTVPAQSAPATGTVASGPTLPAPTSAAGGAFAPSPLTGLANGIRDIAFAALDGRPLPRGPIPIEPSRDPSRTVRSPKPPPASRDLEVLAFAMEVTVVLREPASTPSDDEARGSLEVIAFLSRAGLKVAGLSTRGPRSPRPVPTWLAGVERFGSEVVQALRGRRMGELLVGEAERPVLNDDFLYRRMMDERPKLEQLEEAEILASSHGRVVGYRLDDMFLVTRDKSGVIWGLQLEVDESDGQAMLDGSPLVKVQRLERERLEVPEAPKPAP